MAAVSFETALRAKLEADPKRSRRARRVLEILDSRPSRRRTRRINAMENHAIAVLKTEGLKPAAAIDWSKVDWAKVIDKILDILIQLLPILLAL